MRLLNKLLLRLRSLLLRRSVEQELDAELRFHVERETAANIAAGMTPREARYAALRSTGGVAQIQEECRDQRRVRWIEDAFHDARYALRILRKSPGFAAAAVLSLALGIGANTAIFSLVDFVIFRSLPVRDPQQLVILYKSSLERRSGSWTYPFYLQLRDRKDVFSGALVSSGMEPTLSGDGFAETIAGELVSGDYFETLGVQPFLGRLLTPADDRIPHGHPVVVLSYNFWQRRYGADPNIAGKTIRLNGNPMTIIGVSPRGFDGLEPGKSPDVRVPIMMHQEMAQSRWLLDKKGEWWLHMIARLQPGVSREQAQAAIQVEIGRYQGIDGLDRLSPFQRKVRESQRIELAPGVQGYAELKKRFSQALVVLMGVVGLVLLLACANIANLLLARATARQREIAIRLSLGGSRSRIIRQLLAESLMLACTGGLLGLALAYWSDRLLVRMLIHNQATTTLDLTPGLNVLLFTTGVSLLAGILFGLAPAWRATRPDVGASLKTDSPHTAGGRLFWRKALVSAQVAISVLLLIGAGLFLRTLRNLRNIDLGFDRENLISFRLDPSGAGYHPEQTPGFYRQALERISNLPGVRGASTSAIKVVAGNEWGSGISVEGFTPAEGDDGPSRNAVGPGYFRTLGIPLVSGREFTEADDEHSLKVAIVNQSFVRFYFAGRDPIGRRIGTAQSKPEIVIVGVVKDGKYENMREEGTRFWYVPTAQSSFRRLMVYARTVGDPSRMVAAFRSEVAAIDRNVPVSDVKTMAAQLDENLDQERLLSTLSSFFGGLAALLAAIGLYGVIAYSVARRTREIGIRMALGANSGGVIWLVLRDTVLMIAAGVAAGAPLAIVATRAIGSMLYGVAPSDPLTIAAAATAMVVVALLAGYLPARRASRVDPMIALRYE